MSLGSQRPFVAMRSADRSSAVLRILIIATILASVFAVLPAPRSALALERQYQLTNLANTSLSTEVGTTFRENVGVRVSQLTANGNPYVDGVAVTFTATTSDGGASGRFETTGTNTVTVVSYKVDDLGKEDDPSDDLHGIAMAPPFQANDTAGSYQIVVKAAEPTPETAVPYTFFMTNLSGSSDKAFQVSAGDGSLQATLLNTTYPTPFFANVFDGNNQHLGGVTVTFTAPADGASGLFSNGSRIATAVTDGNGVAIAPSFTANGVQGGYSVTASVSGDQTTSGDEISTAYGLRNSTTNVLGVPETVSASAGSGQQVSVNSTLSPSLQVAVFDGSLAHVNGASVTFMLPATGPSGLFSNNTRTYTTTTGANGLATALPMTTNAQVGQISVAVAATKDGVSASTNLSVFNGKVLTTTTVTIAPSGSSVYGQPVVVSATVRATEGAYIPTGPVSFRSSGNLISGCTSVSPVNGVATCTLNWLEPGNYSYSANYLGDDVSEVSDSTSVGYTVNKASTSIAMQTSHPEFVLEGEAVTFTATVNPVAPGAAQPGEPTGTITFTSSDGTVLNGGAPVALVNGVATVTTNDLNVGDNIVITASYGGDSHFVGSTKTLIQRVYKVPEVTEDPANTLKLVGETVTFTAAADGFPTPTVQWQVLTTEEGAVFTDINGATSTTLSFTAAPAQDQYQYRAIFTNAAGSDTTEAATLTVRQPPAFTSDDSATFAVGEAGSFTVEAEGILPPTISLTGGTLPAGVTFDPATGLLSGTPEVGSGDAYSLTFTATNEINPDAVQAFTLHVNEAPEIVSADATTFVSGTLGTFTFEASGYPAATFSTADPLPGGLSLSAAGVLSGTPTAFGVHTFTVTATNGVGDDATQLFTLTINETPNITTANAATFTVGLADTFTVEATGFPTPTPGMTGTLPTGLTFDPATGVLSGTPADGTGGSYTLTITATNGMTADASQLFTLTVNEAPEFTSANAATFVLGEAGSFDVTASGFPDGSFSVTGGTLPVGVTLSDAGLLSGRPGVGTAGTYLLTITASNGVAPDATQSFTLSVVPPEVIAPDDITVSNDLDKAGAVVTYPAPTAIGNVGTITCTPASGIFFDLGETTVTCSATSGLSDTFKITVLDTQLPVIIAPANISVYNTTGQAGAIVTYLTPVATDNAPGVTAGCLPVSGTFFGLGTTTVTCTATDGAGNTATAKFTVTVIPTTAYLVDVLQDSTATLVTHAATEKALLATLAKVEMYVKAGNPMLAYMTMLQFVVQVDQFADARRITPSAAGQLLTQAQVLVRSIR